MALWCSSNPAQQAPGIAPTHPAGDDSIPEEGDCCPPRQVVLYYASTDHALSQKDSCLAVAVKLSEAKGQRGFRHPHFHQSVPFHNSRWVGWDCSWALRFSRVCSSAAWVVPGVAVPLVSQCLGTPRRWQVPGLYHQAHCSHHLISQPAGTFLGPFCGSFFALEQP